jgi:hypothetical protein
MNINAMRWIDRYVGVPLCAIATPLVRLWHRAFAQTPRSAPRVLFIEMSEMGSTILAAPAMQKARERLGAELFFVIFRKNVGSLEMLGMSRCSILSGTRWRFCSGRGTRESTR